MPRVQIQRPQQVASLQGVPMLPAGGPAQLATLSSNPLEAMLDQAIVEGRQAVDTMNQQLQGQGAQGEVGGDPLLQIFLDSLSEVPQMGQAALNAQKGIPPAGADLGIDPETMALIQEAAQRR
ncbi:MAG: hypothetical protein D6731_15730 [Planctomycetota bacterium]|nr:MAG: hypothetical protein D6731_15730 [Planctomycetota bacterium]